MKTFWWMIISVIALIRITSSKPLKGSDPEQEDDFQQHEQVPNAEAKTTKKESDDKERLEKEKSNTDAIKETEQKNPEGRDDPDQKGMEGGDAAQSLEATPEAEVETAGKENDSPKKKEGNPTDPVNETVKEEPMGQDDPDQKGMEGGDTTQSPEATPEAGVESARKENESPKEKEGNLADPVDETVKEEPKGQDDPDQKGMEGGDTAQSPEATPEAGVQTARKENESPKEKESDLADPVDETVKEEPKGQDDPDQKVMQGGDAAQSLEATPEAEVETAGKENESPKKKEGNPTDPVDETLKEEPMRQDDPDQKGMEGGDTAQSPEATPETGVETARKENESPKEKEGDLADPVDETVKEEPKGQDDPDQKVMQGGDAAQSPEATPEAGVETARKENDSTKKKEGNPTDPVNETVKEEPMGQDDPDQKGMEGGDTTQSPEATPEAGVETARKENESPKEKEGNLADPVDETVKEEPKGQDDPDQKGMEGGDTAQSPEATPEAGVQTARKENESPKEKESDLADPVDETVKEEPKGQDDPDQKGMERSDAAQSLEATLEAGVETARKENESPKEKEGNLADPVDGTVKEEPKGQDDPDQKGMEGGDVTQSPEATPEAGVETAKMKNESPKGKEGNPNDPGNETGKEEPISQDDPDQKAMEGGDVTQSPEATPEAGVETAKKKNESPKGKEGNPNDPVDETGKEEPKSQVDPDQKAMEGGDVTQSPGATPEAGVETARKENESPKEKEGKLADLVDETVKEEPKSQDDPDQKGMEGSDAAQSLEATPEAGVETARKENESPKEKEGKLADLVDETVKEEPKSQDDPDQKGMEGSDAAQSLEATPEAGVETARKENESPKEKEGNLADPVDGTVKEEPKGQDDPDQKGMEGGDVTQSPEATPEAGVETARKENESPKEKEGNLADPIDETVKEELKEQDGPDQKGMEIGDVTLSPEATPEAEVETARKENEGNKSTKEKMDVSSDAVNENANEITDLPEDSDQDSKDAQLPDQSSNDSKRSGTGKKKSNQSKKPEMNTTSLSSSDVEDPIAFTNIAKKGNNKKQIKERNNNSSSRNVDKKGEYIKHLAEEDDEDENFKDGHDVDDSSKRTMKLRRNLKDLNTNKRRRSRIKSKSNNFEFDEENGTSESEEEEEDDDNVEDISELDDEDYDRYSDLEDDDESFISFQKKGKNSKFASIPFRNNYRSSRFRGKESFLFGYSKKDKVKSSRYRKSTASSESPRVKSFSDSQYTSFKRTPSRYRPKKQLNGSAQKSSLIDDIDNDSEEENYTGVEYENDIENYKSPQKPSLMSIESSLRSDKLLSPRRNVNFFSRNSPENHSLKVNKSGNTRYEKNTPLKSNKQQVNIWNPISLEFAPLSAWPDHAPIPELNPIKNIFTNNRKKQDFSLLDLLYSALQLKQSDRKGALELFKYANLFFDPSSIAGKLSNDMLRMIRQPELFKKKYREYLLEQIEKLESQPINNGARRRGQRYSSRPSR